LICLVRRLLAGVGAPTSTSDSLSPPSSVLLELSGVVAFCLPLPLEAFA
jgi:hypothetical protein